MTDLPAPLTHPECDLSDFQYMELDVRRLRDSKFAASGSGDGFRAGVLLWCAAWHQIPAASLPDDDIELANLAGYGRVVKEWRKVREQALSGFVKCSDGRLYHAVIAEKAVAAFAAKERHAYGKLLERLRKENVKREKEKRQHVGIPTFEQWKSGNYPQGIPPEEPTVSGGIPPENPLRGNGEGTEQNGEGELIPSEANASGASPPTTLPSEMDDKDKIFTYGVPMLVNAGSTDKAARSFLAGLAKGHGDPAVVQALRDCIRAKAIDPLTWLAAALPPGGGKKTTGKHTGFDQLDYNEGIAKDGALA